MRLIGQQFHQIIVFPEFHDARLAMVHAGWKPSLLDTVGTQVAQMCGIRYEGVLPFAVCGFSWTILQQVDTILPGLEIQMLLTGDFAAMTSRAELVVNEQTFVSHRFLTPLHATLPKMTWLGVTSLFSGVHLYILHNRHR